MIRHCDVLIRVQLTLYRLSFRQTKKVTKRHLIFNHSWNVSSFQPYEQLCHKLLVIILKRLILPCIFLWRRNSLYFALTLVFSSSPASIQLLIFNLSKFYYSLSGIIYIIQTLCRYCMFMCCVIIYCSTI